MPAWLTFDHVRAAFELAYFCSGVVLALAGLFALKQLRLAKESLAVAVAGLEVAREDIRIRSKREAGVLAVERCEKFGRELLPRLDETVKAFEALGLNVYSLELPDGALEDPAFLQRPDVVTWRQAVESKAPASTKLATLFLNDLEAFAVYFTRGVADEAVAYPIAGALFCSWVAFWGPHLIALRGKKAKGFTSGPYENIAELYKMWVSRMRRNDLEKQVTAAQVELGKLKTIEVAPIGTTKSR